LERGYPIEDVLYRYENHVLPSFEKYIEPYMDIADIVVNNNEMRSLNEGLAVVEGFLKSKAL
jgi:uridine kinase